METLFGQVAMDWETICNDPIGHVVPFGAGPLHWSVLAIAMVFRPSISTEVSICVEYYLMVFVHLMWL